MNRLAGWMMRLYPARWRARYGEEMNALLADTGADARVVADLATGGLRMQFKEWSFVKLALAMGAIGLLLGAGVSFLFPNEYISRATLQITPAQISEGVGGTEVKSALNERVQSMVIQVLSRTVLAHIVNDPALELYRDERMTKPLEDVIEEMKRNIRIQYVALPGALGKRATAFDISFVYSDRFKAQQTVRTLINAFIFQNQQVGVATGRTGAANRLDVLDAPSLPISPFYPSRTIVMLGGFLAGLVLAGLLRAVWRQGFVARRFALVAAVLSITGFCAVFVADRLDVLPYQYRSVGSLRLHGGSADQVTALTRDVLSRTTFSAVIQDPRLRLYSNQLRTTPMEDVIQTMQRHLSIKLDGNLGGPIFTISFDYPDRYKAQTVVGTIMNRFDEVNARLYPGSGATPPAPTVMDVLDTASLPVSPVFPNRLSAAVTGGIVGLIAGGIIAMIRRRWHPQPQLPLDAVNG